MEGAVPKDTRNGMTAGTKGQCRFSELIQFSRENSSRCERESEEGDPMEADRPAGGTRLASPMSLTESLMVGTGKLINNYKHLTLVSVYEEVVKNNIR